MKSKKLFTLASGCFLALILAAIPFMSACAEKAPVTAPATTPAQTQAPAPTTTPTQAPTQAPVPEKVWKLRFSSEDPITLNIWAEGLIPWSKAVEEATKGRVKITIFPDAVINKPADSWSAVTTGLADLTRTITGYYAGQFPLTEVITLPLVSSDKSEITSQMVWQLYEEFPAIQAEYKEVKLLTLFTTEPYCLLSRDKPVHTVDDIKGMKLRATAGTQTDLSKALGASPLVLPFADIYLAMQKGTIDGVWTTSTGLSTFKQFEVAKYYIDISPGSGVYWHIMNLNTWNSFPPDIQQAIMNLSGKNAVGNFGAVYDRIKVSVFDVVKQKYGFEYKPEQIIKFSPEEMAKFTAVGQPLWDKWVEQWKGRGPTQEILNRALALKGQLSK